MTCKIAIPKYLRFDKKPTIGNKDEQGESWDMYLVRKMREESEHHAIRTRVYNSSNTA